MARVTCLINFPFCLPLFLTLIYPCSLELSTFSSLLDQTLISLSLSLSLSLTHTHTHIRWRESSTFFKNGIYTPLLESKDLSPSLLLKYYLFDRNAKTTFSGVSKQWRLNNQLTEFLIKSTNELFQLTCNLSHNKFSLVLLFTFIWKDHKRSKTSVCLFVYVLTLNVICSLASFTFSERKNEIKR